VSQQLFKLVGHRFPQHPIVFVFTNPGESGKEWTVSGVSAFELQAQKESVSTTHATSVFIPHGPLIASISGEEALLGSACLTAI
jgi:hypothetical protein